MYIDGKEATVTVSSAQTGAINAAGSYLRIGQRDTEIFDGLIDDVRIYNRALSADEMSKMGSTLFFFYFSLIN